MTLAAYQRRAPSHVTQRAGNAHRSRFAESDPWRDDGAGEMSRDERAEGGKYHVVDKWKEMYAYLWNGI